MTDRIEAELHALLIEGMIAIRSLLEGQVGAPDPEAAFEIAEVMHNLQPDPVMIGMVADNLERFRGEYPDVAERFLPYTFAWLDSNEGIKA